MEMSSNYEDSEIINIGCGKDQTIRELAEIVAEVFDFNGEVGGGPNCLDNLSIELNSELCILRMRPQAASANG